MRCCLAIVLAAILALAATRAYAQTAQVVSSCGSAGPSGGWPLGTPQNLTQTAVGQLCVLATVTATANTTVAAQSTLPTLSAGTQTPTASLAGAAYVQPVFASASGGGTQVDATHGLPVAVLSGTVTANAGTGTFAISATALPLPSNAAQETGGNLANAYAAIGALGSSVASADTGSFNLNAMIQRLNQHLTTINTTLGSPFQAGGSVSAAQSGNWTSRIVGNGGSTLDAAIGGATAPANGLAVGGQYNSTPLGLTTGQFAALQLDSKGFLVVSPSTLTVAQGSTTSGQAGSLVMAAAVSSAPSNTNGDTYGLYEDLSGNVLTDLERVGGSAIALGQTTMSASIPVAVASNQSAIPNLAQPATSTSANYSNQVPATMTTQSSHAYSAGQSLGGLQTLTVAGVNGQSGYVTDVGVESVSGQIFSVWVYLFNASPANSCTDGSAFSPAAADLDKQIVLPTTASTFSINGSTPTQAEVAYSPGRPFATGGSSKNIYACFVLNAAYTSPAASASDEHIRVGYSLN